MRLLRWALIIVRAVFVGLIGAIALSDQELVSVEIWLVVTAVLLAMNLVLELVRAAAVEPARIAVAWTSRGRNQHHGDTRPRDLRAVEALVTSARTNPRAYAHQLRPRLAQLANHFLPIHRAVDPRHDPLQTRALLGDVAWLIDPDEPDATDRTPTIDELDRFFDIILLEGEVSHE